MQLTSAWGWAAAASHLPIPHRPSQTMQLQVLGCQGASCSEVLSAPWQARSWWFYSLIILEVFHKADFSKRFSLLADGQVWAFMAYVAGRAAKQRGEPSPIWASRVFSWASTTISGVFILYSDGCIGRLCSDHLNVRVDLVQSASHLVYFPQDEGVILWHPWKLKPSQLSQMWKHFSLHLAQLPVTLTELEGEAWFLWSQ